ncbi:MAG: glycosyltransferase [Alistipes sp.]
MFSILVCSIKPEAAEKLRKNIQETIGVPFEFIAFDNRLAKRGICSVYNECARRARYDLLCFVHEDVCFRTKDWGVMIAAQLQQKQCGVVGFAGSIMKLRGLSSWCVDEHDARQNYRQPDAHGRMTHYYSNPQDVDFSPTICLDGLCLMVRKEVWAATPFDEVLLTGFHAYDLDFTTAVACQHKNYVCNRVQIEHFSVGAFSSDWLENLKKYHAKWQATLPLFADVKLSTAQLERCNRYAEVAFIRRLFAKHLCTPKEGLQMTFSFLARHPFYGHSWVLIEKYIKHIIHCYK